MAKKSRFWSQKRANLLDLMSKGLPTDSKVAQQTTWKALIQMDKPPLESQRLRENSNERCANLHDSVSQAIPKMEDREKTSYQILGNS